MWQRQRDQEHPMQNPVVSEQPGSAVYSTAARKFHWVTTAFVFILIPIGVYMKDRGETTNFDALTNTLYSNHKLGGFILLWLVVARLAYRLIKGAPADAPSLNGMQRAIAHLTHWSMYALLLTVPMLGWIGVSLYPALGIPGGFSLPALTSPNETAAKTVFFLHKISGIALAGLIVLHIGAALFHHLVVKDNVLRRMLPKIAAR
jgi:cytochrome b561